ncbi:chromosome transmission fidelity protein 8 homolog [Convolutriloba macropyga]|uniref:chromosome transmission fidelity protein 8 homolog n=1 Tax=Convolutriloba macropyga TaxID=536237 RepID=UPI003F51BE3D
MPNVILRGPSTIAEDVYDSQNTPNVKTWVLIELQGELMNLDTLNELSIESVENNKENEFENKGVKKKKHFNLVGDLHFDSVSGNPLLIVGHHLLTGKREKLMKPYVAMRKRKTQKSNKEKCDDVVYEVYAIAREKLLFNQRPKPIIASSNVS